VLPIPTTVRPLEAGSPLVKKVILTAREVHVKEGAERRHGSRLRSIRRWIQRVATTRPHPAATSGVGDPPVTPVAFMG